jgi:hypothetical protein
MNNTASFAQHPAATAEILPAAYSVIHEINSKDAYALEESDED